MYKATVLRVKHVRVHGNADRVLLGTCHGNQVVVGLETKEDTLGVYFPCDGQLSEEFCKANNLFRDPTKNKDGKAKPGMFDDNRRVRAQKFRGEISDGFFVPVTYFDYMFNGKYPSDFIEGFEFDTMDGVPICNKYVNQKTIGAANQKVKTGRKAKTSVMFKEHFDTAHFGKHVNDIPYNTKLIVTEKIHGTSGRIGHVQVDREMGFIETLINKFFPTIPYKWDYLNGTRRVVLGESPNQTSFHDNGIREQAMLLFKENLRRGETVYFEIVGFEPDGKNIMPSVDIRKVKDVEFEKKWRRDTNYTMSWTYGCAEKTCKIYVYRMTQTNVDGESFDYTWDDLKKRCSEIGVEHVPEILVTTLDKIEANLLKADYANNVVEDADIRAELVRIVEEAGNGSSLLDVDHIKEGVCIKVDGGNTYKHKTFEFKLLEGIIKDSGVVDPEEAN